MSNNVYSEIRLHVTWHVKPGAAIDPSFEEKLHGFIRAYAARTQGVHVHAVNGITDHVHLAVTIPPTLHLSEWIGRLKGASAHYVNEQLTNRKTFGWQAGYGVVSERRICRGWLAMSSGRRSIMPTVGYMTGWSPL